MNTKTFKENSLYQNKEFFEEYQTTQLKFCFLTETESNITNITPWCLCRDFINDTYNWTIHDDLLPPLDIYQYKHNKITKSDLNQLGLKFPSQNTYKNFLSNFHIINTLENFYNSKIQSKYTIISDQNDNYILYIDIGSIWLENSNKLSFYTFLLRQFCHTKNIKNIWNYLKDRESFTDHHFYYTIKQIFKNNYNHYITNLSYVTNNDYIAYLIKSYPKHYSYIWNRLHHYAGFLNYISSITDNNHKFITYDQDHPLYSICLND